MASSNETDLSPHIPANKFNPPRLAKNRILTRSSLLKKHLGELQSYQYTILEAQPGQGKTTTAIQFLSHIETPYIWCQISRLDRDPLYFLTALLEGLKRTFPGFSCPRLTTLLKRGDLTQGEISRPINILLADLKLVLPGECTFVFDDLHLIADADQSLGMIDYMLETAPENISFFILSRRPIPFTSKRLRYGSSTLYLSNEDLALSNKETRVLLEILQNRPADPRTVSNLSTQTGGWVMGVVLAARSCTEDYASKLPLQATPDDRLSSYFEEELFDRLDEDRQQALVRLALLDDIVVELARDLTGQPEIGKILIQLMDENYFIRSLDDDATLFSIHQLFLNLLRCKARQLLSPKEYRAILLQAASYSLKRGMLTQSLNYLLRAEAFSELEELLSQRGMELLFMNRMVTLASVLDNIPPERVQDSAWFSVFNGFVLQKTDPVKSIEFFLQARLLFQKANHPIGELLVLGELVYHHVVLSPDYNRCKDYLDSGIRLFEQHGSTLPSFFRANTAKNLGSGCFYFLNDFTRALDYIRTAEAEAEKIGSPSQLLEILVSHGFIHLYQGKFKQAEAVAERIHVTMTRNDCSLRGLLVGLYFLLQILHLKGDYRGYRRLKQTVLQQLDLARLRGTIIQPYLILYEISMAAAVGKVDQALVLINDNLDTGFFSTVNHLRNEMLATKALILAQNGMFEPEGRKIAEMLVPITEGEATPGYRIKLLLPLALAFASGGDWQQARRLIDREIDLAHQSGVVPFEIYGRLLRAFIATLDGNMQTARLDLQFGLGNMQRQGFNHIRCFSPSELLAVLKLAIKLNVYPDFAQQLAADYLGLALKDDDTSVPLLFITTLDTFELSIYRRSVGKATDFTTTQRQLLGLLVSQERLEISQERAQLILWPDSSPAKGRNRFDAFLSRLRKVLAGLLPGHSVKNYLHLEKGMLSLQNCRIDARTFSHFAGEGLALGRSDKWWQAGNSLDSAMELWSGSFAVDLLPGEQSSDYGWQLQNQLSELGLTWCPVLAENGQIEKAVQVATKIWKENQVDEQLNRLLYRLHVLNGKPVQARKLYRRYENMLHKDGYPSEEIQELLERISVVDA